MQKRLLLTIDAVVNLFLGLALLVFPRGLAQWLGTPIPDSLFYASILGAVLTGIGIALLVERFRSALGMAGLGIGGALVINVCGAGALMAWLIGGRLRRSAPGYPALWGLALLVLGIGLIELAYELRRTRHT